MAKNRMGCLPRLGLLLGAIVIAYIGWRWGSAVFPQAEKILGIERIEDVVPQPTPDVAESAFTRLEEFQDSDQPRFALSAHEISSLLRYSVPGVLPEGIVSPIVLMSEDRVQIKAGVVPQAIPTLPDLGGLLGVLPDTVEVEVGGTLIPFAENGSALVVGGMQANGVPLPRRVFADILEAIGREDRPGLPAEAILLPVPPGVRAAYVEGDSLVLMRDGSD